MVFFSARRCNGVNDEFIKHIAKTPSRYLSIANVDLYGCKAVTLKGITEFVYMMSSRLEHLTLRHFDEPKIKDITSMRTLERLLARRTPSLSSLTLELNHAWIKQFRLNCLDGHPSLRALSLTLDHRTDLPTDLPNLEVLQLTIVDDYINAYWIRLKDHVDYPKLKRLEVTICSYAQKDLELQTDTLIYAIKEKLPALNYLKIQRTESHCPMDDSYDRKCFQVTHPPKYRKPEVEAAQLSRLRVFAKARKIRIDCP
jgi:hypothetical protein